MFVYYSSVIVLLALMHGFLNTAARKEGQSSKRAYRLRNGRRGVQVVFGLWLLVMTAVFVRNEVWVGVFCGFLFVVYTVATFIQYRKEDDWIRRHVIEKLPTE